MNKLQAYISRLAARTALLVVSPKEHPELAERLTDFLQDRGATSLVLNQYLRDGIDATVRDYWASRLEKSAARLEDVVTATLVGAFSSVVGGVLVELWKGNTGVLGRILESKDRKSLVRIAEDLPTRRDDLAIVLRLYATKLAGSGVNDERLAQELYEAVASGGTLRECVNERPELISQAAPDLLAYAQAVARGVVKTELEQPPSTPTPSYYSVKLSGIPLAGRAAFGEVIALSEGVDFGADQVRALRQRLYTRQLYPDAWPQGAEPPVVSPKIVLLSEETFHRLRESQSTATLAEACGLVSFDSGMTSHLAVFSRGLPMAAVSCCYGEVEAARVKFALIKDQDVYFYYDRPNLPVHEFNWIMSKMRKPEMMP